MSEEQKGSQGPPGLDEIVKDWMDKLSASSGKSKVDRLSPSGHSNGSGDNVLKLPNFTKLFALIAIFLAGVWFVMGFYTVNQREEGVVLRLGKFNTALAPGLHWKPYFIDRVYKVSTTFMRSLETSGIMLTKDENIVQLAVAVQYDVMNAADFLLKVRVPEMSLAHAMDSALRHEVGSATMNEVLTEGREVLSDRIKARLQSYMDAYQSGIRVVQINIEDSQAPSAVQDAFDDVIKAREDEERFRNQARAYRNQIIESAKGESERVVNEALGYLDSLVLRAEGDSKRFLALAKEYQKAPIVTKKRLYLETTERILANNPKVLMDIEGSNPFIYLPMEEILKRFDVSRQAPIGSADLRPQGASSKRTQSRSQSANRFDTGKGSDQLRSFLGAK